MTNIMKTPACLAALLLIVSPGFAAFPALEEHALLTPKALSAATLSVTRAGAGLVAVGERGTILLSDDAGANWRQSQAPVSASLTAVKFVNERVGWAVGHLGVVLHSTDGGETWTKQLDGVQVAALVLKAAEARGDEKSIVAAHRLVEEGPDKPFFDLQFSDERHGTIVGAYNLILHTDDGGASWQSWCDRVPNPRGFHLYGIRAAADALYLVGEQGLLLRSLDDGATFAALTSPYKGSYFGLVVAGSGEVVLFGIRGSAFRSGDRGVTWEKIDTGIPVSIAAGAELAGGALALVSQTGDLLTSRDHGRTFQRQPTAEPILVAGLAQATDASIVVASLRGPKRLAAVATHPTGAHP